MLRSFFPPSPHGPGPGLGYVSLTDVTWQDMPQWSEGDTWVAYRSPTLVDSTPSTFPGLSVATSAHVPLVEATVRMNEEPRESAGLVEVHRNVLEVGLHGFYLAGRNHRGDPVATVEVPPGSYPVSVWVDGAQPSEVTRVEFRLSHEEHGEDSMSMHFDDSPGPPANPRDH